MHQINLGSTSGAQLLEQVIQATSTDKPTVLYLVMHNPELILKKVISMLSKILDGETDANLNQTVIAGSSVRPALPSELRRPGRFTHEIYIGLPDNQERFSILSSITINSKLDSSVNLKELANLTRGYTPADLHHLLNSAAQFTIKRNFIVKNGSIEDQDISQFNLDQTDFLKAIQIITPTVYNEFGFSMSKITWEDLGGHSQIKNIIWDQVIQPRKFPEYYRKTGVSGVNGILLYGPPGNGKTTLAKAIANAADANFLYVNSSDFIGVSGGVKRLAQLFDLAQEVNPTLLFFDEVDGLLPKRDNASVDSILLVNEFLTNMDGAKGLDDVLVVAATNYIEKIDEAALRPGRLELKLLLPPPDDTGRLEIFKQLSKDLSISTDLNYKRIVNATKGGDSSVYSFADINSIVKKAGNLAAQEAISNNIPPEEVLITMNHFLDAINTTTPSILTNE
ncbi:MAG: AAA family ATPase [Candidatus Kariarchaeaceae archaeon]